jgi:hypothetical protein
VTTLLLIHGGLWENIDAERFWYQPGIVTGLRQHGFEVMRPTVRIDRQRGVPRPTTSHRYCPGSRPPCWPARMAVPWR